MTRRILGGAIGLAPSKTIYAKRGRIVALRDEHVRKQLAQNKIVIRTFV